MHSFKTRGIAILGALVAGTAALAPAAHADVPKARVSYADLDVHSEQGRKQLAGRIHRALNQVCDAGQTDDVAAVRQCRDQALDRAYADLQLRGVTIR